MGIEIAVLQKCSVKSIKGKLEKNIGLEVKIKNFLPLLPLITDNPPLVSVCITTQRHVEKLEHRKQETRLDLPLVG